MVRKGIVKDGLSVSRLEIINKDYKERFRTKYRTVIMSWLKLHRMFW